MNYSPERYGLGGVGPSRDPFVSFARCIGVIGEKDQARLKVLGGRGGLTPHTLEIIYRSFAKNNFGIELEAIKMNAIIKAYGKAPFDSKIEQPRFWLRDSQNRASRPRVYANLVYKEGEMLAFEVGSVGNRPTSNELKSFGVTASEIVFETPEEEPTHFKGGRNELETEH